MSKKSQKSPAPRKAGPSQAGASAGRCRGVKPAVNADLRAVRTADFARFCSRCER